MNTNTHPLLLPLSRRQFVKHLALWGSAALVPAGAALGDASPTWTGIGQDGKYKNDTVTQVTVHDDLIVYVRRDAAGTFSAFSSRCTHLGCTVDWDGHRRQYVCPCHHGVYDEAGKHLSGPPPKPLRKLLTRVDARGVLSVQVTA